MQPQGVRLEWDQVAPAVRDEVASVLGSPVRTAVNQPGGFSPGVAARCELADGRRCFIKAVSADQNPDSPDVHRREGRVTAAMPPGLPVPTLLAVIDDERWVVLVLEEIDGRAPWLPWSLPDLRAVLSALDQLAAATTPCPIAGLPSYAELHAGPFTGYRTMAAGDPTVDAVDPWSRRHLAGLAELEDGWPSAAAGDSLVHADVRADNLLVRPDGTFVLVDWPHASVGAPWVDKAGLLPSVGLDGGPQPWEVERELDPFAGVEADQVDRMIAALAGYFTFEGAQPDPPGLPTLRAFQRAQGEVARAWLARRLGWR